MRLKIKGRKTEDVLLEWLEENMSNKKNIDEKDVHTLQAILSYSEEEYPELNNLLYLMRQYYTSYELSCLKRTVVAYLYSILFTDDVVEGGASIIGLLGDLPNRSTTSSLSPLEEVIKLSKRFRNVNDSLNCRMFKLNCFDSVRKIEGKK